MAKTAQQSVQATRLRLLNSWVTGAIRRAPNTNRWPALLSRAGCATKRSAFSIYRRDVKDETEPTIQFGIQPSVPSYCNLGVVFRRCGIDSANHFGNPGSTTGRGFGGAVRKESIPYCLRRDCLRRFAATIIHFGLQGCTGAIWACPPGIGKVSVAIIAIRSSNVWFWLSDEGAIDDRKSSCVTFRFSLESLVCAIGNNRLGALGGFLLRLAGRKYRRHFQEQDESSSLGTDPNRFGLCPDTHHNHKHVECHVYWCDFPCSGPYPQIHTKLGRAYDRLDFDKWASMVHSAIVILNC